MWKSCSLHGFKSLDELLSLTVYEFNLMMEAHFENQKEQSELQFYILKRAISDVLNGGNQPLFKELNRKEMLSKEHNEQSFKDFLEKFNKIGGDVNG